MRLDPLYADNFDFDYNHFDPSNPAAAKNFHDLLTATTKHRLTITGWQTNGPAGGNPNIQITGTLRNILSWISDYFNWSPFRYRTDISDTENLEIYLRIGHNPPTRLPE